MRIAVIQFKIAHQQPEKNLHRIDKFIARAAKKGAQVVVLPEDCFVGSIFGDLTKLDCTHFARDTSIGLAKKYMVDIVSGSTMEAAPDGNFNVSYYINKHGEVLNRYCKNHLYPSEYKFLSPGTEALVFETDFGKAAIVICWDMLFAEIFERLKQQGVQIIYCPSYWYREIAKAIPHRDPLSEEHLLDALCLTRAVETNAVMVYVNAAGRVHDIKGGIDTLIGHSQIVMPGLGVIKRLTHHRQTMFTADINLDHLTTSKAVYHA